MREGVGLVVARHDERHQRFGERGRQGTHTVTGGGTRVGGSRRHPGDDTARRAARQARREGAPQPRGASHSAPTQAPEPRAAGPNPARTIRGPARRPRAIRNRDSARCATSSVNPARGKGAEARWAYFVATVYWVKLLRNVAQVTVISPSLRESAMNGIRAPPLTRCAPSVPQGL